MTTSHFKPSYRALDKKTDVSDVDHIIIGSGIGGLTAAAWLAMAGKKVIILEKHYTPGGFTHNFSRRKGFRWDVGVHYVGNMAKANPLRKMFDFITNRKVDWEYMGDTYDVIIIGDDKYEIKAGRENFKSQLSSYFPEEKEAIDKYVELIDRANKSAFKFYVQKAFPDFLHFTLGKYLRNQYDRYSQRTTMEVLSELTDNKRLIAVLCGQCGNYGLVPSESSFAAHSTVIGHFMDGGYYPIGGADQITLRTIENIRKHGGEVYINSEVKEIIVKNNKVQGVQLDNRFIPCKSVISNAGINVTFSHLLKNHKGTSSKKYLHNQKPSTGHMCLYVGLDKSDEDLDLPKYNLWCYKNENIDAIKKDATVNNIGKDFAYISFPSAKDPNWKTANPNTATIQAVSFGKYEWVEKYKDQPWKKRDLEYKKMKEEFENVMLERLYKLYPQLKGHVVETEVSSPLSTKHFTNYQFGEIYGLEHSPNRFKLPYLRALSHIKGLRLAGQDIIIVGLASAMISGILVVSTILKFKIWKLFRKMGRQYD